MYIKPYIKLSALVALSFLTSCVTVGQIDIKDNTVNARADAKVNTNVNATANVDTNVKTGNINNNTDQWTYYDIPLTVPDPVTVDPGTDIFVPNPNIVKSVSFVVASPVSLSLNEEEQATIVGTTNWSDGTKDSSIVWTSSNSSVLSVDSSGNVRAIKSGNAIITATSRYDASKSAVISIVVNKKGTSEEDKEQPTVLISSISVIPTFATIKVGEFFSVNASIEKSDGSKNSNVSWQSSDTSIATVTSNGSILAKKAGNVTIKAISNEDSSKYASLNLIIQATAITDPTVTATPTATTPAVLTCEAKITGDLSTLSGSIRQLTAVNVCSDGTNGTDTFSWSSSDKNIAIVDNTGRVTGIKAGNVNLTATSNLNSSVKTSVPFKVSSTCAIVLSGNLITSKELGLNSSKQLTGTVTCNDGVTSTSDISWSSSDSSVANVNTSGLVQGFKKGNAKITATYKNDISVTTSLDITVSDSTGNEQKATLAEGKLYQVRGIDVRNGKIYVSDYDKGGAFKLAQGQIQVLDTSGSISKTIQGSIGDSLPGELTGIATDGARVWVTNRIPYAQSKNNIYSFSTDGGGRQNAALGLTGEAGTNFQDLAIDPSTSSLYVASAGTKSIIKVNYDSSGIKKDTEQKYFSGATQIIPAGIGLDNLGNVYATDASSSPATIIKFGKGGDRVLTFNSTGTNGTGPNVSQIGDIAVDTKGTIYVSANYNGANVILRYDSEGKFIRSFGEGTMTDPRGIAVGADGTLYVADYAKASIIQFGPGK